MGQFAEEDERECN